MAVSETLWLRGLLDKLQFDMRSDRDLRYDNKVTIQISANHTFHEQAKDMEIDYDFVRKKLSKRVFQTEYVTSHSQLTDPLINLLGKA